MTAPATPSPSDDLATQVEPEDFVNQFAGGAAAGEASAPSDDWVFPSQRGRGRPRGALAAPLTLEVIRVLTPEDVPEISLPAPPAPPQPGLQHIKYSHHQLARLLAQGVEYAEVSFITGYSPQYVGMIQRDPAFIELMAYYATQREQIFLDAEERMKTLGLNALDEIQRRLESEPDKWTRRELMELSELMLVKSRQRGVPGAGNAFGAPGSVAVSVQFVSPGKAAPAEAPGIIIDQPAEAS